MSTKPRRLRIFAALTLVAILIAPFAGFVSPGRASAASARLTLSKSSALPGASVTASGSVFPKRAKGQLVWAADGTVLASFTTSSSGSFRASFRVPNAAPNSYIVAANVSAGSSGQTGSTSLVSATANLQVSATATPTKTPVPPTATTVPTDTPTKAPTKTPTPIPPTATETPTAAPTDTQTPTDTPLPTATSTQTSVPTDTPTETATASSTPSATATSTKTATATPTKTATTAPSNGLKLSPGQIGVNLAGAEFTDTKIPGTYNSDYTYPTASEYDYYASKGLTLIRLPFRWERIQPVLGAPLDPTELSRLDQQVAYASARGMRLILDVHNYARYRIPNGSGGVNTYIIGDSDGVVTVSDFQDLWTRLAAHFAGTSTIWAYDLMNEPHDMGATSWATIAQAAVNAIRQVDSGHTILVPGDCWSGAWTWASCNSGLILSDPAGNLVYEAHQYFDRDGSGTYANSYDTDGATATTGADRLKPFANWLAANGLRGYIGEFGAPNSDPRWQTVLDNFLGAMAGYHLMGTAWSGGPWWGSTYPLRLDPVNGADEPSVTTIVARLS